jgi:hypothetical protein
LRPTGDTVTQTVKKDGTTVTVVAKPDGTNTTTQTKDPAVALAVAAKIDEAANQGAVDESVALQMKKQVIASVDNNKPGGITGLDRAKAVLMHGWIPWLIALIVVIVLAILAIRSIRG